jgi:enoyl-CoA hydratase/carnithine racemase
VADEIQVAVAAGVCTVTLNRPHRLNAFTPGSYRALAEALRSAAEHPDVRVVLLRGAGRAFSSGVDLDVLDAAEPADVRESFVELLDALLGLPQPLVAAVQGPAVGFGMTILLHADLVLFADDARLRAPFIALGTAPEAGSSVLLPAAVGPARAAELVLTGRWVGAEEAVALGLGIRVCPVAELAGHADELAAAVAAHPREPLVAAKGLLREGHAELVGRALERERAAADALRPEGGLRRDATRA